MSEQNDDNVSTTEVDDKSTTTNVETKPNVEITPEIQALIDQASSEKLKDIKAKLDKSYKELEAARAREAEIARKEREAELKALEEAGKYKEAADMRVADAEAKQKAAEQRVVELTRDSTVRSELSSYDFRNKTAQDIAAAEITKNLIQNERGEWVTKQGKTVADAIKDLVEDKNFDFLIKPKTSTGGGTTTVLPKTPTNQKKSLFSLSQEEVLEMASKGQIPKRG